jgi:predicted DNA-binding transcriptional regulator AlpA
VKKYGKFSTVREITTFSRSNIDRLEKQGKFPKRIKISANRVVWDLDEVLLWLETKRNQASAGTNVVQLATGSQNRNGNNER